MHCKAIVLAVAKMANFSSVWYIIGHSDTSFSLHDLLLSDVLPCLTRRFSDRLGTYTLTMLWKNLMRKMRTSRLLVSHDRQNTERNCLHQDALYLKKYMEKLWSKGYSSQITFLGEKACRDENKKYKGLFSNECRQQSGIASGFFRLCYARDLTKTKSNFGHSRSLALQAFVSFSVGVINGSTVLVCRCDYLT